MVAVAQGLGVQERDHRALVDAADILADEADEPRGVHLAEDDLAGERAPGLREHRGLGR